MTSNIFGGHCALAEMTLAVTRAVTVFTFKSGMIFWTVTWRGQEWRWQWLMRSSRRIRMRAWFRIGFPVCFLAGILLDFFVSVVRDFWNRKDRQWLMNKGVVMHFRLLTVKMHDFAISSKVITVALFSDFWCEMVIRSAVFSVSSWIDSDCIKETEDFCYTNADASPLCIAMFNSRHLKVANRCTWHHKLHFYAPNN